MEADAARNIVMFAALGHNMSLQCRLSCPVEESGKVLILARVWREILASFSDEATCVTVCDNLLWVKNAHAAYTFTPVAEKNFCMPDLSMPDTFIDIDSLPSLVTHTAFCSSKNNGKMALQCMHLQLNNNKLVAESTDGFRLVQWEKTLQLNAPLDFLLPAEAGKFLASILQDKDVCKLGLTAKHILFLRPNMIFAVGRIHETEKSIDVMVHLDALLNNQGLHYKDLQALLRFPMVVVVLVVRILSIAIGRTSNILQLAAV